MRVLAGVEGDVEVRYEDIGNVGTLENPSKTLFDALAGQRSWSGIPVSPRTAITGTIAVYACLALLAEVMGSLPCVLYNREAEDRRTIIPEDRTYYPGRLARQLRQAPNPEMTAQEFWEMSFGHTAGWGNFYANVPRGGDGRPVAMWPLRPDWTEPLRDRTGRKFYRTHTADGEAVDLEASEVFHMRTGVADPSNPMKGLSPIGVARNAIGIEQAATQYAGRFYSNSAMPGGVISVPNLPKERKARSEEVKFIRRAWQSTVGGLTNAQRVGILYGGATWQQVGIPPIEAQFIETRKFQVVEIARLYRIPPHVLGDVERSTSWGRGIEEQVRGLKVFTFRPWLTRTEAAVNRDMGTMDSKGLRTLRDEGIYAAFNDDALLRGDTLSRYMGYAVLREWGLANANELRAKEDEPPIEGPAGTEYLRPANYVPAGTPVGAGGGDGGGEGEPRMTRELLGRFLDQHPIFAGNGTHPDAD